MIQQQRRAMVYACLLMRKRNVKLLDNLRKYLSTPAHSRTKSHTFVLWRNEKNINALTKKSAPRQGSKQPFRCYAMIIE